jgi:hypothetical protein
MAPEQARGEAMDHRADLFSLGSVLYALCTGVPPFQGASPMAVLEQVSQQAPTPLRTLNPAIPSWLETLIARLMAKEPAERFQSAAEVATLLEGYLAHLQGAVAAPELPATPRPRLSTRGWLMAAGLLCGLGVLVTCLLLFQRGPGQLLAGAQALPAQERKSLEPKDGLVCLLVNKNSGRCLSITDGSAEPGAKIVQGPTPEQAGAAERWRLRRTGKAFRLRNESTQLFLEIGSANLNPGVQAIQWHDEAMATHQQWTFEPVRDSYLLRVGHSELVLGIGEGSQEMGGRAIQWEQVPDVLDQHWYLLPVAPAQEPLAPERCWPLRGEAESREQWHVIGAEAEQCVRFEEAGLRIHLPLGWKGARPGTGICSNFGVRGDFVITMTYEILKEPEPAQAGEPGTRLSLGVKKVSPQAHPDAAAVHRRMWREAGSGFEAWASLWNSTREKAEEQSYHLPLAGIRTGRLRLIRAGPVLSCYAAEGLDKEFFLLKEYRFGAEDVQEVRIAGSTGGANAELDVRVTDVRLRTGSLLQQPAAEPQQGSRRWWATAGLFGVVVLSALGVWFWTQRRRRPSQVMDEDREEDAAPITFACSRCGKHLKTRAELAGKKIKCPGCGQSVRAGSG